MPRENKTTLSNTRVNLKLSLCMVSQQKLQKAPTKRESKDLS